MPECVALGVRETVVVFGTVTGSIKIFSLEAEKCESVIRCDHEWNSFSVVHTLTGHTSIVSSIKQSPLSQFIWASASLDNGVRVFDLRAGPQPALTFQVRFVLLDEEK